MKGYWKILLILMLAVGFASCEDDQGEIEYVITGRAWTGDVGMNADNGEALFSTFEFGLDGFGVETQFYASDGALYDQYRFRWYWGDSYNRNLVLDYGTNGISFMDDVRVYGDRLSGIFYLSDNAPGFNFELRME